jgi:L-seryl-tRNA(Ser) seleniumtransferase
MTDPERICHRFGFKRALNAIGMPTILGANTASPGVRQAVDDILQINVEIDELQAAACRVIARATGAEAGCVTSSCSAGLVIAAAAAMTGPDLARISRLPDTGGMANEVLLMLAHDVNFGAPVSQMIRLSGAQVVYIGTASHCEEFHVRGVLHEKTAALFYIDSGVVNPAGDGFPTLEQCVALARAKGVPVVVDAAARADVRPYLAAGADLVIVSAHKQMGAPTSGMICGRLDLVRACYLQNYGIGRAMKVGKEGIAGCMAAVEAWYSRDLEEQQRNWRKLAAILAERVRIHEGSAPHAAICALPESVKLSARAIANRLREGSPPVWVRHADDERRELHLDLRVMNEADARCIAERLASAFENPMPPAEDVPFHDLYWSARRLLEWPSWR